MNLRKTGKRKYVSTETINWKRLHDENLKRLGKNDIKVLETWFPLEKGEIFGKLDRLDGMDTRMKLLQAAKNGKISLKVAQLEVTRRKRLSG